ncbi:MAG: hypothetical protein Q4C60_10030 [Eubacteriales bacterium]|nr:hypothetical protein [Eubacteriales bacterium]
MRKDARISDRDTNNFRLPTQEDFDHKEIMSFFVRECVEDKEQRKQLFYILRRHDYMDSFLEKLRELELYEEFLMVCGDIYEDIFEDWAKSNGLSFGGA